MTVSGPQKILYLTLGIFCLVLGVVGLLIPIIPGFLFLAGAVYLLTRGSSRVRQFADTQPHIRKFQSKMDQIDRVSITKRIQIAGLMALNATVSGVHKLVNGLRRLVS